MPVSQKLHNCGSATCTALLKTMLFFFNILFFALGGSLVFIGAYGLKDFHSFFSVASSSTIWAIFLCTGLFIISVAIMSFWFIPKGVRWLLYSYGVFIFFLGFIVLGASSAFLIKRDMLEDTLQTGFARKMNNYPKDSEPIDYIQRQFSCCGVQNYTDWFSTEWANKQYNVPESCCMDRNNCVYENLNLNNVTGIWKDGCFSNMKTLIENQYTFIGAIGLCAAVFIFFGSILSCWLATNLKRNRYESIL